MTMDSNGELASFHRFVAAKLSETKFDLSPDDAVDLWRAEHPYLEEFDDATEAVMEALADIEAGDVGITLEEFDREFRARHHIPSRDINTEGPTDAFSH